MARGVPEEVILEIREKVIKEIGGEGDGSERLAINSGQLVCVERILEMVREMGGTAPVNRTYIAE